MRLAGLYLRSRLAGYAALCLAGVALLSWAGMAWTLADPTYSVSTGALIPMIILGTLTSACVVALTTHSPFGDVERTAARTLPPLRLGHIGALILWGALTLATGLLTFDLEGAWPANPLLMLLRDLAGFAGLALLAARLLGSGLSWTAPLVYAAILLVDVGTGVGAPLWAWPLRPGTDGASWSIALVMLATGLALVCSSGTRESVEQTE